MKTSNKLLIMLAALLIVVPIVVIAINVNVNYVSLDEYSNNNLTMKRFDATTPNFKLHKTSKPFNRINVTGSEKAIMLVTLVENANYGFKISDEGAENFNAVVDANQVLHIIKKEEVSEPLRLELIVFAPKIDQLSAKSAMQLTIDVTTKVLNLDINRLQSIFFNHDSKIDQLNVTGENVYNFSISDNKINSLRLKMKNIQFRSGSTSYKLLALSLSGSNQIEIGGGERANQYKIDSLSITDLDRSTITLSEVDIIKANGNFSDSTNINASTKYLKLLFKK